MPAIWKSRPAAARPLRHDRAGLTLFELMVVLAIIVLVGAMIVPNMEATYNVYQVSAAADQVRACWALASAHAIEEGRPYRFAIHPGTGAFKVAPHSSQYWSHGTADRNQDEDEVKPYVKEDQLPKGVAFAVASANDKPAPDGQDAAPNEPSDKETSDDVWDTVAVFRPDGSADEDVELRFQAQAPGRPSCRLRALPA